MAQLKAGSTVDGKPIMTVGSEEPHCYLASIVDNPNAYDDEANDEFGQSASISGDYAIVGASEDDASGLNSGKAYIFNTSNGTLLHTLHNPNPSAYGWFGKSVSISGNRAIVGAYHDDATGNSSGRAYIFNVMNGALVHILDNPSPGTDDRFGRSVSISGNYAIVGAYYDDTTGTDSGRAYIFNVTTGNLAHTLNNPNAYGTSASDSFGFSVSISGNYAIVGADTEDDAGGTNSGKAYIFDVSTGNLAHTLNNPNAYGTSVSDFFGISVSISGNYVLVGAQYEDDASGTSSGKAYIFDVSTGNLVHTLNNPNAYSTPSSDYFGVSVGISGNYAIVGAWGEDDAGGSRSGKAYIFDVTTGNLLHTLDNPNNNRTSENDYFGESVGISGDYAIVGAYWEDERTLYLNSGKAYIYRIM
jgi:hypothetical protein